MRKAVNTEDVAMVQPKLYEIIPGIQNYTWGGTEYIPSLLDIENMEKKPYAELWIGTHPVAPAKVVVDGHSLLLHDFIKNNRKTLLGSASIERFGTTLPYLFKVLDAQKMLSIQVHPSKQQAAEGFERENRANIPLTAKNRNYKDNNHKPEIHVALTEFWMLHGFRPLEEIDFWLDKTTEFNALLKTWDKGNLSLLYETIMTMPQDQIDSILQPLVERLMPAYRSQQLDKDEPHFWAARAADLFPLPGNHLDRGIFSIYLFNLLHLRPGQGTFQAAGVPHAYLQGTNVELMANSDNVLRGGLTPKHIDVKELLKIVKIDPTRPQILEGEKTNDHETLYPTPVKDFKLSRLLLKTGDNYISQNQHGLECLVLTEGSIRAKDDYQEMSLNRGKVFMAPANVSYTLEAKTRSILFKAAAFGDENTEKP